MKEVLWSSRAVLIGVVLLALTSTEVVLGTAETANQARTNLQVVVTGIRKVGASNQTQAVAGAQVLVKSELRDQEFNETLSTDPQGIAHIANVPRGPVLIQVTAQGWITGGIRPVLSKKDETVRMVLTAEAASPSPTPPPSPSPSPSPSTRRHHR